MLNFFGIPILLILVSIFCIWCISTKLIIIMELGFRNFQQGFQNWVGQRVNNEQIVLQFKIFIQPGFFLFYSIWSDFIQPIYIDVFIFILVSPQFQTRSTKRSLDNIVINKSKNSLLGLNMHFSRIIGAASQEDIIFKHLSMHNELLSYKF